MLVTIRETIKSLGDLGYGKEIIKKTVRQSYWYWLKYPLTIGLVLMFAGIAAVTYFSPQIPKLADQYLPEGDLAITNGMASTTMKQPLVWEDSGFAFIFNLKGIEQDLDDYQNGVLILEDRIIAKGDTSTRVIKWSEFDQDFKITKADVIDQLSKNKFAILGMLLIGTLVLAILGFGLYVLLETTVFLIWSVLFWIVARVLHKSLKYLDVFKLSLYAAVPAILVNLLNLLLPNSVLPILSMGVFVFYSLAWLYRLPSTSK